MRMTFQSIAVNTSFIGMIPRIMNSTAVPSAAQVRHSVRTTIRTYMAINKIIAAVFNIVPFPPLSSSVRFCH